MIAGSLDEQEPEEMWSAEDPSVRHRSSWPSWGGEGSDAAACYFEVPAGCSLGPHVHDAEEQVVVFEGAAVARIGEAEKRVAAPALVVMPKGATHDLRNEGAGTLRAVGYFASPSVTTVFETKMEPSGSKTAGTPDRAR